jgi:hypothetical protein
MMHGISSDTRAQDLPHRHTGYPTYGKSRGLTHPPPTPNSRFLTCLLVRRSLIDELVDCGDHQSNPYSQIPIVKSLQSKITVNHTESQKEPREPTERANRESQQREPTESQQREPTERADRESQQRESQQIEPVDRTTNLITFCNPDSCQSEH